MPSKGQSSKSNSGSSNSGYKEKSDYEFVKPWGGMHNFMMSYGIKPEPGGYEEAKELIEAFRETDRQQAQRQQGRK